MNKSLLRIFSLLLFLLSTSAWAAFSPFVVEDIRLEGLKRISIGTVFNYLPIRIGDEINEQRGAEAIRALFRTGFFDDVMLGQEGNVLVVVVKERPAIADIKISGNRDIETDQLKDALKEIGLAKGRTFDRSILEKVEQELERQYFSRGKYGVRISSSVEPLERNRVDVKIDIFEGAVAKIVDVNLIGNTVFSEEELLSQIELGPKGTFSLFGSSDQYSRQKLSGDLETLKSYYLDRGYVNFTIDSTQVSITPDKRNVFITVNMTEGEKYTIKEVRLAGNLVVPEDQLRTLLKTHKGEVFSRRAITESVKAISDRLGEDGYAFSNINPIPDIDNQTRDVTLTFYVDPGRRIYVRRINITGNARTEDEVLRREMRQMEGGWIATDQVNRSRVRLQRLGYFDEVNVETPAVPGIEDQVDVNYSVTERSSGSLQAGLGFSESQGVLLTASISHDNFMGTGKRISAEINNSKVNTIYSFSYTNPYYTLDGVSRGFRGFYRKTDAGQQNTADFNADTYGVGVEYGIPVTEYNQARIGLTLEHTQIRATSQTPQAYLDFLEANTDEFEALKLDVGWSYDSRDRAIFPESGGYLSIGTEAAVPGSQILYYKVTERAQYYQPLIDGYTLLLRNEVGYGDGFGGTTDLPFWEHFFAGGGRSVRGYRSNTLGPAENGDPIGGAFKVVGNAELIFPVPFSPNSKTVRMSAFVDVGNVFEGDQDFDVSELRMSTGVSAIWLSPIGPMIFSLGKPLREFDGDQTETFQFTLGASI